MKKLRVIGIGSPFGDDQVGLEVVKILEQTSELLPFIPRQLQLIYADRPGLHLLELMRDAHNIFIIDAVKTGAKFGTLHCFKGHEIEAIQSPLSSHALGIAYAIKMGRALGDLPENIILYGIEINEIKSTQNLALPMIRAANKLAQNITTDILQTIL